MRQAKVSPKLAEANKKLLQIRKQYQEHRQKERRLGVKLPFYVTSRKGESYAN